MQVCQEGSDVVEYAVQPCDASGDPVSGHLTFFANAEFAKHFEPFRMRVRAKPTPKVKRNNKPKKMNKPTELHEDEILQTQE